MISRLTILRRGAPVAVALCVAACSPEGGTVPPPTLGDTVRHNMAVHVLPLPPSSVSGAAAGVPGPRAGIAIDRYMEGQVNPPQTAGPEPMAGNGGSAPSVKQ
jgi:hypothetical protein